ncbi:hypothetical protein PMIN03_004769 [Paraphaeosphaeria minitans]
MPIHKLNRTRNRLLHANGNPSRGYLGLLEVSHQLHCLNQYTWKPYYAAHADLFANLSDTIDLDLADTIDLDLADARDVGDRMHVDHCLETLRLTLMCNADVTPTVRWRERYLRGTSSYYSSEKSAVPNPPGRSCRYEMMDGRTSNGTESHDKDLWGWKAGWWVQDYERSDTVTGPFVILTASQVPRERER